MFNKQRDEEFPSACNNIQIREFILQVNLANRSQPRSTKTSSETNPPLRKSPLEIPANLPKNRVIKLSVRPIESYEAAIAKCNNSVPWSSRRQFLAVGLLPLAACGAAGSRHTHPRPPRRDAVNHSVGEPWTREPAFYRVPTKSLPRHRNGEDSESTPAWR